MYCPAVLKLMRENEGTKKPGCYEKNSNEMALTFLYIQIYYKATKMKAL